MLEGVHPYRIRIPLPAAIEVVPPGTRIRGRFIPPQHVDPYGESVDGGHAEYRPRQIRRGSIRAGDFVIDGRQDPAAEVGGDYYDILDLPGGRIGVAVAVIYDELEARFETFGEADVPALRENAETPEGKAILARLRFLLGNNGETFPTKLSGGGA